MRIIFCDSGFSPKEVDYMYAEEYKAAKQHFIPTSLISFEALKKGNLDIALKRVQASETKEQGIYRGWMLRPKQYKQLYEALLDKNIELINTPDAYKFCHYLPENYEAIKTVTPKTTFKPLTPDFDIKNFEEELDVFDNQPIVIKDYVKSQKHYWAKACFIPDASDRQKAETVIRKFIELQDEDFNEGLVFREFVELEQLTNHAQSGMPLTKEFRVFIKNGEVMTVFKYWDEGDYENAEPEIESFRDIFTSVKSRFFTMDIAKKKNGDWIIVELGDGQVAGLPDNADKGAFYSQLNSSYKN